VRLLEASFVVEREVQARANAGRNAHVDQIDWELAGPSIALAYLYFGAGDEDALMLVIDLDTPVADEEALES
jgi:hypothetical protein